MLTDLFLYLLIALVFVGFFLLLAIAKDSQTVAERDAQQHTKALVTQNSMMGYGILAGVYLVLFLGAHILRKRLA